MSDERFLSDAEWAERGGVPRDPPKKQHIISIHRKLKTGIAAGRKTSKPRPIINKIVCRLFGHQWTYYPYEGISCRRCKEKKEE